MSNGRLSPPATASDRPPTAATRHLCAGAHVDSTFRDVVIRKVHNAPYSRVAPSYGFDIVPVIRHAWLAWILETVLLAAIPVTLGLAWMLGHPLAAVLAAAALAGMLLAWFMLKTAPGLIRLKVNLTAEEWRERTSSDRLGDPMRLQKRIRQLKAAFTAAVILPAVPAVAVQVLAASLRDAAAPAAWTLLGLAAVAALVGGTRQVLLNRVHNAGSLRPSRLTRRESAIDTQQEHGCVVYRRPNGQDDDDDPWSRLQDEDDLRSPFVGGGELVHRWIPPLTIQLLRPDADDSAERPYTPPPFSAHELVDRIKSTLKDLDGDAEPARMRGIEVSDCLYIAEADLSADRRLLRDALTGNDFSTAIDDPHAPADHFLVITVPSAGGELVTTLFLRVSVKGRTLSLEFAACALPRTPDEHRKIDGYAEHGAMAVVRSAIGAVFELPKTVRRLYRLVEAPVVLVRAAWAAKDRTLRPRRGVMAGTRVSVREAASQNWDNISQRDNDVVFDQMKIIEQWILTATEKFLDSHDLDISTFKKQAVSIINSGVLNMGGKTEVKNSAVGANSQASNNAAAGRQDGADDAANER